MVYGTISGHIQSTTAKCTALYNLCGCPPRVTWVCPLVHTYISKTRLQSNRNVHCTIDNSHILNFLTPNIRPIVSHFLLTSHCRNGLSRYSYSHACHTQISGIYIVICILHNSFCVLLLQGIISSESMLMNGTSMLVWWQCTNQY